MAKRPIREQVAENIARIRRARGLTQEDLAKRLGQSSVRRVSALEREARNLTLDTLEDVAEALDVHPSELILDEFFFSQKRRALAQLGVAMLQAYLKETKQTDAGD